MIDLTLRGPARLSGVGLHSGALATVIIHPAEPGFGIRFRTATGTEIVASANAVVDTARCTVLGLGSECISTVEHLLSACVGLGITDARIEIDGPEVPIGDGSAQCWTDLIQSAGFKSTEALSDEEPHRLHKEILVTGNGGSFVAAYPSEQFTLTVAISFPHPLIGTQIARFASDDLARYATEVAPARTFGFIEEVEALRASGLAMGGSFDNAIVVYPDHYSSPLRYENELARHKLLDVLGDLALSECSTLPFADIIAVKPSHRLNVELARRFATESGRAHTHEG